MCSKDTAAMTNPPRPFRGPARVWFGDGASERLPDALAELGVRSGVALLVTDAVVDRLGLARGVEAGLRAFAIRGFNEIPGEPTLEVMERAVRVAREAEPAVVIGVGGGSVMDTAKIAAAFTGNPGPVAAHLGSGARALDRAGPPLVLVPTTAGTGAEASQNAVMTASGGKVFLASPHLLAHAAILDPLLTASLPPTVTAHTGLDALSHCAEALLSAHATPLTDTVAEAGVRLIVGNLAAAVAGGGPPVRAAMLYAAYLGGLALNAGMVIGHSVAYTVANRLHIPHGLSCALALPYAMAYNRDAARSRLERIAALLGLAGAGAAIGAVEDLAHGVGVPHSLREMGLAQTELPAMLDECMARYPRPNNPRPVEEAPLRALYHALWDGRPASGWRG